jgi:hypothetical protein
VSWSDDADHVLESIDGALSDDIDREPELTPVDPDDGEDNYQSDDAMRWQPKPVAGLDLDMWIESDAAWAEQRAVRAGSSIEAGPYWPLEDGGVSFFGLLSGETLRRNDAGQLWIRPADGGDWVEVIGAMPAWADPDADPVADLVDARDRFLAMLSEPREVTFELSEVDAGNLRRALGIPDSPIGVPLLGLTDDEIAAARARVERINAAAERNRQHLIATMQQIADAAGEPLRRVAAAVRRFAEALQAAGLLPEPEPDDVRERSLQMRRQRHTGPDRSWRSPETRRRLR